MHDSDATGWTYVDTRPFETDGVIEAIEFHAGPFTDIYFNIYRPTVDIQCAHLKVEETVTISIRESKRVRVLYTDTYMYNEKKAICMIVRRLSSVDHPSTFALNHNSSFSSYFYWRN